MIKFTSDHQRRLDPYSYEPFVDFVVSVNAEVGYHLTSDIADQPEREKAIEDIILAAKTQLEKELRKYFK
jgi:hypothetical protein